MALLHLAFAILIGSVSSRATVELKLNFTDGRPLKLAFGSCFRIFDKYNDIFKTIGENKPHLWTWMGDAAYTDFTKIGNSNVLLRFKNYMYIVVKDNSMSLEYIIDRFNTTLNDTCKQQEKS